MKMINYIRADLYRLGQKRKSNITLAVVLFLSWSFIIWRPSMFDGHMDAEYTHAAIALLYRAGAAVFAWLCYSEIFIDDRKEYVWSTGVNKIEYVLAKISTATIYLLMLFLYSSLLYLAGWIYSRMWVTEALFDHNGIQRLIAMTFLTWFGSLILMLLAGSLAHFFKSIAVKMIVGLVFFMRFPHFIIEIFYWNTHIEDTVFRFEITTLFQLLSTELYEGKLPTHLTKEYILALVIWFICAFACYVCILEYKEAQLD